MTARDNPLIIETPEQLQKFCEHLQATNLICFDTEFVAEDSYKPELCLIQVATPDQVAIIDPYSVGSTDPFWQCIVDPSKKVVVHAGREECLFCFRATGQPIAGLFDVQLAAGFLGHEFPISYGNLVSRMVGTVLDKEETRSDWRRRPLSPQQLKYASADVEDLPEIYESLSDELASKGRDVWFHDEAQSRQQDLLITETEEQWHRLSGVQSLGRQSQAIAYALWRWRDEEAKRRDMPPRRVLRDDLIIELSKRKSSDARRMANLRGMENRNLKSQLPAIADVIEQSRTEEPPQWPVRARASRIQPPTMLTQFLASALASICRRKRIAASIVGTSEDLKAFVSYRLSGSADGSDELPSLLRGWRSEIVGKILDDLLSGKASMRIHNPTSDLPLRVVEDE